MCYPTERHQHPIRISSGLLVAVTLLLAAAAQIPSAVAVEAEWIMYRDPILPRPTVEVAFPPGLPALWCQALEMPQREMKLRAAAAITSAHKKGLTGLEIAAAPLMKLLEQADQERTVRLAAARALVELDAQQAADLLFQQLNDGDVDAANLLEPALARWGHPPMRDAWLQRLEGPITVRRLHVLAIRGLTLMKEAKSLPRFLQLAQGRDVAATVRQEAALALGQMQQTGLEQAARALMADKSAKSLVDRLIAARMLASHRGHDTELLLTELATDPQPSVQAIALGHLFRIDPELITPIIDATITSSDVGVRRWVADALVAKPTPEKVARLGPLLDDADPALRRHVCDCCVELAQVETLRDAVINQGRQMLAGDSWRGQEQATLLLVTLDDKSIVDRLLALLDSTRPEVHTTAAWGLSRLEVPATLEPILAVFRKKCELQIAHEEQAAETLVQLSHLAQAMGQMNYFAADEALRVLVPQTAPFDANTRSAAIWALGRLHVDKPDEALANQLMERIKATRAMFPEDQHVGATSAVALGRMKATNTLADLREFLGGQGPQSELNYGCAWAISQMTGEKIPEVLPFIRRDAQWFLTPVD